MKEEPHAASMTNNSWPVCFPSLNMVKYIQVFPDFLFIIARNGIFFYPFGWDYWENQKSLVMTSLPRYADYRGNSIQYHPVQLIVCAGEESKLWRLHYAKIFRSRHISSGSG